MGTTRFFWESSDCRQSAKFYQELLSLERLAEFSDHDGFSGVVLGWPQSDWQIEIVTESGRTGQRDDVERGIVLYLDTARFAELRAKINASRIEVVWNKNPYWTMRGAITIRGYDGESIIFVEGTWSK